MSKAPKVKDKTPEMLPKQLLVIADGDGPGECLIFRSIEEMEKELEQLDGIEVCIYEFKERKTVARETKLV